MTRVFPLTIFLWLCIAFSPAEGQCPGGQCPLSQWGQQQQWGPTGYSALSTQHSPLVEPPARYIAASVKVQCSEGRGVWGSGSGTVIGMHGQTCYVLTNKHVVAEAQSAYVLYVDRTKVPAQIVAVARDCDLALVSCPAHRLSVSVPLAESSATEGESVWQLGYPGGGDLRVSISRPRAATGQCRPRGEGRSATG